MKSIAIVAFAALALGAAGPWAAASQEGRRAAAQRANRPDTALTPGDVVAMLDAYAVVQAQDALQLSEQQYGPFVTRLRALQETRRRNQQARSRILQQLRQAAGTKDTPPQDEAVIRESLKALREHDERSSGELKRAYDALDEVIDIRQQARFRVLEETIERRKLDLLMRARQAARRGSGG